MPRKTTDYIFNVLTRLNEIAPTSPVAEICRLRLLSAVGDLSADESYSYDLARVCAQLTKIKIQTP